MSAAVLTETGLRLAPHELEIVRSVLMKNVPGRRVWAYGSRATGGRLKRFSDLDLAVEGGLNPVEVAGLREDFEESRLPMAVDVVALAEVSDEFRLRIESDFVTVME